MTIFNRKTNTNYSFIQTKKTPKSLIDCNLVNFKKKLSNKVFPRKFFLPKKWITLCFEKWMQSRDHHQDEWYPCVSNRWMMMMTNITNQHDSSWLNIEQTKFIERHQVGESVWIMVILEQNFLNQSIDRSIDWWFNFSHLEIEIFSHFFCPKFCFLNSTQTVVDNHTHTHTPQI